MDTLLPVIVGGIIGSLGPLVALIIQGRQNREIRQEQQKEALETRAHEAREAKNERIRQACADLLGALLAFETTIPEAHAVSYIFRENAELLEVEGVRLSAVLRSALLSMDNARRTLLLYAPDFPVMSLDERLTFQTVAVGTEKLLGGMAKNEDEEWKKEVDVTIQRLKQSLPAFVATL